ncbi:hypothetical protein VNI00_011652 [Paramarasmius palmivorus]|uniref:Uncharacterized protein n=1 Tax=Paramarasmius palmivorus TaxID=297713 RepID=A0AAW0CCT1_9AGAR
MQRLFFSLDSRTDLLHILQGAVFLKKDLKPKALSLASIPTLHSFKPPEFDITGLTSLYMSGSVTFSSTTTRQVVEFIRHLTYLESLHLEYSKLGKGVPQALSNAEPRRRLRPVRVSLPYLRRMNLIVPLDDFLPWLGRARLPSLVYLHIFMIAPPPRDRGHIAQLLQSFIDSVCARTVKDVCIRFMREALPVLDLSRCKALRGIRFMEWNHSDAEIDFSRLTEIIQTIASPVSVFASEWPNPPRLDHVRWFIGKHLGTEWQKEPERSEGNMFFPIITL